MTALLDDKDIQKRAHEARNLTGTILAPSLVQTYLMSVWGRAAGHEVKAALRTNVARISPDHFGNGPVPTQIQKGSIDGIA